MSMRQDLSVPQFAAERQRHWCELHLALAAAAAAGPVAGHLASPGLALLPSALCPDACTRPAKWYVSHNKATSFPKLFKGFLKLNLTHLGTVAS